jgi:hypothetical protein
VKFLFNQYAETLFKGLSWDVNLRYTSESEQKLASSLANSIGMALTSSNITSQPIGVPPSITGGKPLESPPKDNRGEFASKVSDIQTELTKTDNNKATAPTKFDWHERSNFICDAIQKRGLNPDDFGCL